MQIIAEGCPYCEPLVDPQGDCEGEHHIAVRLPETMLMPRTEETEFAQLAAVTVLVDGESVFDVTEAWTGTPGRVIRLEPFRRAHAAAGTRIELCFHQAGVAGVCADNHSEHQTYKRWLIEYDSVEIRKVPMLNTVPSV